MAKREIKNPAVGLFNTVEQPPNPRQKTSVLATTPQPEPEQMAPSPMVVFPEQREPRSQRKQILLQPSIHKRAEAKCKRLNISMNEAINQLLENWVSQDE